LEGIQGWVGSSITMSETDFLKAIEAAYDVLPKKKRIRILKEIEAENENFAGFLKKFFPKYYYKEIHTEEDAKQRRPKRRKKLLRKRS
jgi:hypothetical protein